MKEFISKHIDTVIVLGGILSAFMWMNSNLKEINDKMASLDKRLTVIETVMMCNKNMPSHIGKAE